MSEWWTYSLHDFLLFSPRTYYRLIELYNGDVWPAQIIALVIGLTIAAWMARTRGAGHRVVFLALGAAWAWVAGAWLAQRYATINWAATYAAYAFAVEAILLLAFSAFGPRLAPSSAHDIGSAPGPPRWTATVGWLLMMIALAYPAIAWIAGRGPGATEVIGLMPDPTVLATLAAVALAPIRARWTLLPVPIAWCAFSGATLWALDAAEALVLPVAAVLTVAAMIAQHRARASRV